MTFLPIPIEPLVEGEPAPKWQWVDDIEFEGIEASLHLFMDIDEGGDIADRGWVHGFIKHDRRLYYVGELSAYGFDSLDISFVDRTADGRLELQIVGMLGSTYMELKLIRYNAEQHLWENILTMGSPYMVDLDDDGEIELVAVSTGSVPSFVNIYRWHSGRFEKASVTDATDSDSAVLSNTGFPQRTTISKMVHGLLKFGKTMPLQRVGDLNIRQVSLCFFQIKQRFGETLEPSC